ncbi:MAG: HIT domain-containing protein [Demequina sp.]
MVDDAEMMGGEPDGFERLWTPHRMAYIKGGSGQPKSAEERACPLCKKQASDDDRQHLIVHRGEHNYVVLNLYPYNPGHLMICPYRHVGWYTEATDAERDEMGVLTQQAMTVLQRISGTKGFNIGMNQGVTGGAGISEHLHQHVVPRWVGDSNFLPIIAKTKAVPELLDDTWQRVSEAWTQEPSQDS